ncbi:MAG: hypothetical protein CM15mP120_05240 [Pseudomonadota bacterium]|nr:MAG: hypothetical protein CM15mP120_05240 [Pseudomonadota bacterium]
MLGLILDSAWIHLGILDFGADSLNVRTTIAPLWIVMLWVAVGLSLFEALGFFVKRPLVGALSLAPRRRCPIPLARNLEQSQ